MDTIGGRGILISHVFTASWAPCLQKKNVVFLDCTYTEQVRVGGRDTWDVITWEVLAPFVTSQWAALLNAVLVFAETKYYINYAQSWVCDFCVTQGLQDSISIRINQRSNTKQAIRAISHETNTERPFPASSFQLTRLPRLTFFVKKVQLWSDSNGLLLPQEIRRRLTARGKRAAGTPKKRAAFLNAANWEIRLTKASPISALRNSWLDKHRGAERFR